MMEPQPELGSRLNLDIPEVPVKAREGDVKMHLAELGWLE